MQAGAVRNGWFDTVDLSGPHTPQSLRSQIPKQENE